MTLVALIKRHTVLILLVMLYLSNAFKLSHQVQKFNRKFFSVAMRAESMTSTPPLRDADEIELAGLVAANFFHNGDVVLLTGL